MQHHQRLFLLGTLVFAACVIPSVEAAGRVKNRQNKQEKRIEQGDSSGQLTSREERRLDKAASRNERAADRARADGEVTGAEKARMEKRQDRLNKRIYKEKHDGQTVDGVNPDRPGRPTRGRARQHRQDERIEKGVRTGNLTEEEASVLSDERRENAEEIGEAREDGKVTRKEKAEIERSQDELSKEIRSEAHDDEKREPAVTPSASPSPAPVPAADGDGEDSGEETEEEPEDSDESEESSGDED